MGSKVVLLLLCFLISGVLYAAEKPLTNQEVVKLTKLGIGDEAVIAKIRQAPAVDFKLETDELGNLKAAGVSGKVIAAMLERSTVRSGPPGVPESVKAAIANAHARSGRSDITLAGKDGTEVLQMRQGEFRTNGFMGIGNNFYVYSGAKCSTRTADKRPTITLHSDVNPESQIFIVKLEAEGKDNERSLKVGSLLKGGNPFKGKSEMKPDPDWTVAYDATESPTGVWHLTPKNDLKAGEYGIYRQFFVYDFGVD